MKPRTLSQIVIAVLAAILLIACSAEPEIIYREVEVTRVVVEEKVVEVEGETVVVTELVIEEKEVVVEVETVTESESESSVPAATPEPIIPQNPDDPNTMIFEDIGETNPFIDTRDDNLSTFAIDVDTGAYTLMRSYLSDHGNLPPAESVRVEEYVNFFDYDYAPPSNDAFAIHLDGAPTPYGESEEYHLVRVGVQGYEVPAEARPDALLIFVIDVSGSMGQQNRLQLVKESLRLLVDSLRPTDRVGIVVYGSSARTVLDPTSVDSESKIMSAIDNLRTEGSTNAEAGIEMGYEMANRYRLDGDLTRLIVLSDGVANVGNTTAESILDHARRGISLSTFGFGMGNYNDALMEQLANQGDGTYAYIDTLREAQRLFVTDLTSTLVTIAKDAKIQVEFNPNVVERYRLIGYENRAIADQDFRNDAVDAGEIGAGHSVTALYEIRVADDIEANQSALTVRVRYQVPDSAEIVEIAQSVTPDSFYAIFTDAPLNFQLAATVAEYAELLRGSFWARESDLTSVWQEAERIARSIPNYGDVSEWADLVESAASYSR